MSQTTTPSGAESNSRAAFEHFMSNAGANPEAIERAFYTYKQAKSANYFHVWSYCWSVREETVAALIARNAELEADAGRWREVSDKAWFIDAAAYVYGLRTGTFDPTPEEDEVIAAVDAARTPAKENDDA